MTKNPYPGKLIVFEGIDGAGKGTQSTLLFNFLKKNNVPVEKFQYPEYKEPIGKLIRDFLYKKYELSANAQFLLYFADFLKDSQKIMDYLKTGEIVICDRYLNSALAYQGLRGFPIENALKIAEIFRIPKPDAIIYLKIGFETAISRKTKEKKNLDRNEKDKKFLKALVDFYQKLIKRNIFGKWVVVDGEKPIKEVFKQVKKICLKI